MEWKSNAKFGTDLKDGTIFRNRDVSIHRFFGIESTWFLTYNRLGISQFNLRTNDFEEAVNKSKEIIRMKINELENEVKIFLNDNSTTKYTA